MTAQTVYGGLGATYQLHDPLERAVLPQGEFDVPLVLTDMMFAADGRARRVYRLPTAIPVRSWRHAPAERYEVLVDFRRYPPGTRVVAQPQDENNIDFDNTDEVVAFDVVGDPVDTTDPTWTPSRRPWRTARSCV